MESQHIVRAAGIAAVGWVGVVVAALVRGSSGPVPDPTQLLLRLTIGPLAFLLAGNAVAWLVNRVSARHQAERHPHSNPSDPLSHPCDGVDGPFSSVRATKLTEG